MRPGPSPSLIRVMGVEPDNPSPIQDRTRTSGAPAPVAPPSFATGGEAPTESLVAGTMGDRCVNCGAPLADDQRYCVVCGERRGAARFTLPTAGAAASTESTPSSSGRRE